MIPFLPAYIPPDVDMNQVKADVAEGGGTVYVGSESPTIVIPERPSQAVHDNMPRLHPPSRPRRRVHPR